MALFCAAATAWLIAVYCAEPSSATVIALALDAAEGTDADEEVDEMLELTEEEVAVDETANEDVDPADDAEFDVDAATDVELDDTVFEETDASDWELDWAATRPTSPTRPVMN